MLNKIFDFFFLKVDLPMIKLTENNDKIVLKQIVKYSFS